MCDMTAYVVKNEGEEVFMASVTRALVKEGKVELRSLFGEAKTVSGSIIEVDFDANRIVIAS